MSLAYRMMYRLGVTPWEHAEPPGPLAGLIEGPDALPPGDMLDIGCGTGRDAIYCARHGWTATGVDTVARALDSARRNARQAGANVRFLQADITRPGNSELGGYTRGDGRAGTREVKLARLFTVSGLNDDGRPVTDPDPPPTWPPSTARTPSPDQWRPSTCAAAATTSGR